MINIFLPGDDLSDHLLHIVNVVGLVVNLSQRFNVILPFLNQKSISSFRVILEFFDGFIHFFFEFGADSFNKFVQFDEIVILAEFLFDFEVFGSCWPVVHAPEIFFFEFFESDEVIFALFVAELGEAD